MTRALSFSEATHFSIVTISTVGYGDIVPASNIAPSGNPTADAGPTMVGMWELGDQEML